MTWQLLEARLPKVGRREYAQVLRLRESCELDELHAAVEAAQRLGAISFDTVKHPLLYQLERRPLRRGQVRERLEKSAGMLRAEGVAGVPTVAWYS